MRVLLKSYQVRAGIVDNGGVAAKQACGVEIEMVMVELLDMSPNGFRPCRQLRWISVE